MKDSMNYTNIVVICKFKKAKKVFYNKRACREMSPGLDAPRSEIYLPLCPWKNICMSAPYTMRDMAILKFLTFEAVYIIY